MVDLAIIIPCYNEGPGIKKTLETLVEFCVDHRDLQKKNIVIIPVNDGSTDSTGAILEHCRMLSKSTVRIEPLSYPDNIGKGGAIIRGAQSITARSYGFTDADLSYAPSLIPEALEKLHGAVAVVGERKIFSSYSWPRRIFSKISNRIVQILTGLSVSDTQCGFKFFDRRVVETIFPLITQFRFSFDIEFIALLQRQNLEIRSLKVEFAHRKTSTVSWYEGVRYCLDVMAIYDRLNPRLTRQFVATLAAIATIGSAALFGWTVFHGYFFSDDFTWIWHGMKINGSLQHILVDRMSTFYSPVLNAFYTVAYKWWGVSAPPYFFAGIVVHILTSTLFALFAFLLTRSRISSTIIVLIATIAGSAYEPLVWIGANIHSIATVFIVTGVLLYAWYLVNGRSITLLFSLVAIIFAYGSKEIAIAIPVLLAALTIFFRKKVRWSWGHIAYALTVGIVTSLYAFQQFEWQRQSIWMQQGVWALQPSALIKLPLVMMDMVVPLRPVLSDSLAPILWGVSVLLIAYIWYRFRALPMVHYGLLWATASLLPTIFFRGASWWELSASRYTYLPRLGIILVIASIVTHLIHQNTRRSIIDWLAGVLFVCSIAQIAFMVRIVNTQYSYVYQTGRSLVRAAQSLAQEHPSTVIVDWNRPFTDNHAHIVGALAVIAGIPEEHIFFLERNQPPPNTEIQTLLQWNATKREYVVVQRP